MTTQFRLPDLGEGITEAELVRWLVKPGDTVIQDQEVVEVQTDKAMVELPSPVAGTILELNVTEGQIVPVQTVLLTIGDEQTEMLTSSAHALHEIEEVPSANITQTNHSVRSASSSSDRRRVLATPVARKMARDLGIDLSTIEGSGPAGRVRIQDVQKIVASTTNTHPATHNGKHTEQAAEIVEIKEELHVEDVPSTTAARKQVPVTSLPGDVEGDEERIPLRGLRRRIAENMVLSVSTIPQVSSLVEIDATELIALRRSVLSEAEAQGVKLSYLPFIIKALIHALRLYPYVNASIDDERKEIVLKHTYSIGIATATPDGLLVPVLRNADRLTILDMAREIQRLAVAGRERKLQVQELRGSSFTISNYGTVGGFFTTPIINPGEAGILGLGKIVKRPWVVDDQVEVRSVLPLSFTADHRLIDGELAMRFLNTLIQMLEHPNMLLLHMR